MRKDKNKPEDAAELRRQAEERLKDQESSDSRAWVESDARRLVHELQVHQIELEMQNEELRNARDDADAWLALYTDLYDFAPLAYFSLDRDGSISRLNLAGAQLLGVERSRLVNARFGLFVSPETLHTFNAFLMKVFEDGTRETCELVLAPKAGGSRNVHVEAATSGEGEERRVAVVDVTEAKRVEAVMDKWSHDLGERVKELTGLYAVSSLLQDSAVALEEIAPRILKAIVAAYQFPEITGARLALNGTEVTESFRETAWKQSSPITIRGTRIGALEVCYLEERPPADEGPFLKQERDLIDALANQLGQFIERKRTEEEISSLARFPAENPNPIVRISGDGKALYANPAAEALMQSLAKSVGSEVPHLWGALATEALERGEVQFAEQEHEGRAYAYHIVPISESGYVNFYAIDITARKRAEEGESLARQVLEVLNRPDESEDSIRRILLLIKESMGFEAVGIRMREGEDYPYYHAQGFTEDFVNSERFLCARDEAGEIIRDDTGAAVLECMCGNIILGRTDRSQPFFTETGSFWTNSTTKLLASTTETDRLARTRNRCNREGYESVALIPLRSGDEVIGLLQLNDRRPDQFTLELIRYLEALGSSIGIALTRRRAVDALRESREQVVLILESILDAFFSLDQDWRFTYVNSEVEILLGKSREQLMGANIWDQFPEALGTPFQTEARKAMIEKISVQFEAYYSPLNRWLEVRAYPYEGGLSVYFRDCSDRRAAQEILANASQRNARIADILQQALIPPPLLIQPEGYEIAARYQPALKEAEVCGDFYDLFDLGHGNVAIVVGDIVGKGLNAAARVAAARHTLRSYAFVDDRPSNVMRLVNDALCRDAMPDDSGLTVFLAVLDTRSGVVTYSNAGHEPPLVMRSDGSAEYLTAGGPMVMGMCGHDYFEGNLSLQADDLLVLVTDGITEAREPGRLIFFGSEGIVGSLSGRTGASAEQIADGLLEDTSSYANGELRDDAVIVVVKKLKDS